MTNANQRTRQIAFGEQKVVLWINLIVLTVTVGLFSGYRLGDRLSQDSGPADLEVSTRVYPVADILAESDNEQLALSRLLGYIHEVIDPASWNSPDRKLIGYARFGSIEVQQTEAVHQMIGQFLNDVRVRQAEFRQSKPMVDPILYINPPELVCSSDCVASLG